jgi:hypothetical protein
MITQLKETNFGISQDSVLGLALYLLYIANLPIALDTILQLMRMVQLFL